MKSTQTVSVLAAHRDASTPRAITALNRRAPSTWNRRALVVGRSAHLVPLFECPHRAAGDVVGLLQRDERRPGDVGVAPGEHLT